MKKITLSALATLILAVSITSCKKGKEDPGFTLLSRKARVAGEWKITEYTENSSSTIIPYSNLTSSPVAGTSYVLTNDVSHDGSAITVSTTSPGVGGVPETNVSKGTVDEHSFIFDKKGTWSSIQKTTITVIENKLDFYGKTYTETTTTISETTSSGIWDFLGGIGDDYKNKERLLLSTTVEDVVSTSQFTLTPGTSAFYTATSNQRVNTYNNTYDANKNVSVFTITQLKNKEMKVESSFDSSSKGRTVYTSAVYNDDNKNDDVTTTGTASMIFSTKK